MSCLAFACRRFCAASLLHIDIYIPFLFPVQSPSREIPPLRIIIPQFHLARFPLSAGVAPRRGGSLEIPKRVDTRIVVSQRVIMTDVNLAAGLNKKKNKQTRCRVSLHARFALGLLHLLPCITTFDLNCFCKSIAPIAPTELVVVVGINLLDSTATNVKTNSRIIGAMYDALFSIILLLN